MASNNELEYYLKLTKIQRPTSSPTCGSYVDFQRWTSLSPRLISPLCADMTAACLSSSSRRYTQASGLNARHTWIESVVPTHSPGDVAHSILRQAAKSPVRCEDLSNSRGPGDKRGLLRLVQTSGSNLLPALCHSLWELKIVRHESDVISVFPTTRTGGGIMLLVHRFRAMTTTWTEGKKREE